MIKFVLIFIFGTFLFYSCSDFLFKIFELIFRVFEDSFENFKFKKMIILNNENLIFLNKSSKIKILKTDKTKEEIENEFHKKLSELNILNLDFNDYFIFVDNDKIKKFKKEKLLKKFEQNIKHNIHYKLSNFNKLKIKIKRTKKQNIEQMVNNIIFENSSNLKTSNSNKISLENSIKEIKN